MTGFDKNINVYDRAGREFVSAAFADICGKYLPELDRDPESIYVFPAFCDVHVHLREPGFVYKETIASGTLAAAHGGYTDVCSMPNLDPVPDCEAHLKVQAELIERDALIRVHPYGAITEGERGECLAAMDEIGDDVVAFSDDGRGVQSEEMMTAAMTRAAALGRIIAAHCEDNSMLCGGYIHDGEYARAHGHRGISGKSEWAQIERDLFLAEKTGCAYHVCHISCGESVELIRQAKRRGVDVTCETAPHYLVLCDDDLREDGRFKMNPPLRSERDRNALLEGIADGTIDMIATDHAPHSREEKSRGLRDSLMGITGLECAFPVLYTKLVKDGVIPLTQLIYLMSDSPRRRFSLPVGDDICVFDLGRGFVIEPSSFKSLGKSTPFEGTRVFGENILTVCGGRTVWTA